MSRLDHLIPQTKHTLVDIIIYGPCFLILSLCIADLACKVIVLAPKSSRPNPEPETSLAIVIP
jgi:hypothetical protein